jgi:hypothetical protein
MKSFRELFGLEDPLLRQADTLVQAAETYAIGTFTPLLKKFSFLREVDNRHWDFILTMRELLTRLQVQVASLDMLRLTLSGHG